MDDKGFKQHGREVVDMAADYRENNHKYPVSSSVEPGYLKKLLPNHAPESGEDFQKILEDVNKFVIPGLTHWQSPHFHAYYPGMSSYPSILADILSAAFNCIGFSWATSPAVTELEMIMLDWLGKLLLLPDEFLFDTKVNGKPSLGGGAIQGSASEALLVALIAAREDKLKQLQELKPDASRHRLLEGMVAYCSDQTHSAMAKGCRVAMINYRALPTNDKECLDAAILVDAIQEDEAKGLVPFFLCATLGTTSTCAFDDLASLGPPCQRNEIWLHVDAAYAGPAFICEEYRPLLNGIEYCSSYTMNCHKWMLVAFDCSPLWVKDKRKLIRALNTQFVMFNNDYDGIVNDFKDWQVPLGRRFRSLKLWFVLRTYGASGIKEMIRKHCRLTTHFRDLVANDERFEVFSSRMGLCCCRLRGDNETNQKLLDVLDQNKTIHMTPTVVKGKRLLRFAACAERLEESHVDYAWSVISKSADLVVSAKVNGHKEVEPQV